MSDKISRRKFLAASGALPVLPLLAQGPDVDPPKIPVRISLNAYSFNRPLKSGSMDLYDLIDFCVAHNFDALDLTAYYFPGYPEIPENSYLYQIKRYAFLNGLEISGTGVRNDFTDPDPQKRAEDTRLILNWVTCAAKLGAPVIRVFSGKQTPSGYTRDQIAGWVVESLKECAGFGRQFGVLTAVQNHNDFLRNADDVLDIISAVDSEWFGLVLDIGSFREGDPYEQIARLAPYAVNWQIKELVYVNGSATRTDLSLIAQILRESGYRGYIPIETLGEGDPRKKVIRFLEEVRAVTG